MTDLDRLIEAVESGRFEHNVVIEAIPRQWENAFRAFHGSLDDAVALKNALLPEWIWGRQVNGAMWVARRPFTFRVLDPIPARALLLATLKAYRERMKG